MSPADAGEGAAAVFGAVRQMRTPLPNLGSLTVRTSKLYAGSALLTRRPAPDRLSASLRHRSLNAFSRSAPFGELFSRASPANQPLPTTPQGLPTTHTPLSIKARAEQGRSKKAYISQHVAHTVRRWRTFHSCVPYIRGLCQRHVMRQCETPAQWK